MHLGTYADAVQCWEEKQMFSSFLSATTVSHNKDFYAIFICNFTVDFKSYAEDSDGAESFMSFMVQ